MIGLLKVVVVSLLVSKASFLTAALDEVDSLVKPPVAVHRVLGRAERQVILGCMEIGNMQPYFDLRKVQIVTQVETFIDGLLPINGPFLHRSVVVGGVGQPADHSRDAFKTAFGGCIISAHLGTAVPDSKDTDALSRFKQAVNMEFREILYKYVEELVPVCTVMLHYKVKVKLNKYEFMGAIWKLISDVESHHDAASLPHPLHELSLNITCPGFDVAAG